MSHSEKAPAMRHVYLAIETIRAANEGCDRIVEIGAVDVLDGRLTGRTFQARINPKPLLPPRGLPDGSPDQSLLKEPSFKSIAPALNDFLAGTIVFIHDARAKLPILDAELAGAGIERMLELRNPVRDTRAIFSGIFPGQDCDIPSLSARVGVHAEASNRSALRDATLLARLCGRIHRLSALVYPQSTDQEQARFLDLARAIEAMSALPAEFGIAYLQRHLTLGYRAAIRAMNQMCRMGLVEWSIDTQGRPSFERPGFTKVSKALQNERDVFAARNSMVMRCTPNAILNSDRKRSMKHAPEDLLWTIQAKFGENLATAHLKWLLGDPDLAAKFLSAVASSTPEQSEFGELGTLTDAQLEVATLSQTSAEGSEALADLRGRLDMLVETDRCIIGVESKIHALFQDGQPHKYLETIKKKAQEGNKKSILLILTPAQRLDKVRQDLGNKANDPDVYFKFLDWQSLIATLANQNSESTNWKVELLEGYIKNYCDPLRQVKLQMHSSDDTSGQSALGDSDVQSQFMKAMVASGEDIPGLSEGKYVRNTKNYLVYEFDLSKKESDYEEFALFGFVNRKFYGLESAPGTECERAFVICHPRKLDLQSQDSDGLVPPKTQLDVLKRNGIKGIIRHKKEDGEIWVVPDQTLRDIVNMNHGERRLAKWLAWIYLDAGNQPAR